MYENKILADSYKTEWTIICSVHAAMHATAILLCIQNFSLQNDTKLWKLNKWS